MCFYWCAIGVLSKNNEDMARPPIIWTDEMLEDFITFYPVMSNKELAEIFMVSINTIRRKAKEMMLEKSPISHFRQKTIETVMRMFGKHTAREMGKEAGVSTRTIYRICKQLKLKMSKEEKSKIFSDAAYKMLKREYSRKIYGLEPSTLRLLGKNKRRTEARIALMKHGYITIKGCPLIYYNNSMTRYEELERNAEAYGYQLVLWK